MYDRLAPSASDMQSQMATNLPWFIIVTDGHSCSEVVGFGDCLTPEALHGRVFIHGIWDCYSLVRDYFRMEKNIILPQYPRSDNWWNDGANMYEDNFKKAGFIEVMPEDARAGDAILYSILSACCNHAAIYLGDGEILHHLHGRKSGIDIIIYILEERKRYLDMLISFHGNLTVYGQFDIQAKTPAQALGIIFAQMPELAQKIRQGAYKVFFDGQCLDELEFEHRAHWKDTAKHIRIVPIIEGAKGEGVGKVILGVVLIGAAILTRGVLAGAGLAALTGGMSGLAFKLGVGLVLAGVGSLLAPKEKEVENPDDTDTQSFAWNGPSTRIGQGHPLPMIYGHVRTGGYLININTDVVQLLNKDQEDLNAAISDFKARLSRDWHLHSIIGAYER